MKKDSNECDFLQSFLNKFSFLNDLELIALFNSFMDDKDHIYYIEMACVIGPKPIIDEYYKNSCFTLNYRNGKNITKKIKFVIDKSKGNWEFETNGKLKDCARIIGAFTHNLEFITGLENIEINEHNIMQDNIEIKKQLTNLYEYHQKNESRVNETLTKLIQLIEIGQNLNNISIQKIDFLAAQNTAFLNEFKENNAILKELLKNNEKIAYEILSSNSYKDNFFAETQRLRNYTQTDTQKIINLCNRIVAHQDQMKTDLKEEIFGNSEEILNNINFLNEKLTEHSILDTIRILIAQVSNHQKPLQQIKSNEI
jgi:hypothetical protein